MPVKKVLVEINFYNVDSLDISKYVDMPMQPKTYTNRNHQPHHFLAYMLYSIVKKRKRKEASARYIFKFTRRCCGKELKLCETQLTVAESCHGE